MSLDELATAATKDLLRVARARTDTSAGRAALDHTVHVRRRGWTVAAMATAVTVVLVGTSLVADGHPAPPAQPPGPPAQYVNNGPIFVVTVDGYQLVDPATGARTPVDVGDVLPTERTGWSPDGTHLAFFGRGRSGIVDLGAGHTTFLDVPEATPFPDAWFPTGRVVWSADGTFSARGSEGLSSVSDALPEGAVVGWVAWSPDGRRAAFVTGGEAVDRQLYVVNADGTGLRELPARLAAADLGPFTPAWAPDGSRVLYVEVGPIGQDGADASIMTIEPDGSNRTRVTDAGPSLGIGKWETYPVWSPDSRLIAFFANFSGTENGTSLYVTDLEGHVHHVPTGAPPEFPALAWRPVP